jgi:hypothetical protein
MILKERTRSTLVIQTGMGPMRLKGIYDLKPRPLKRLWQDQGTRVHQEHVRPGVAGDGLAISVAL